MTDDFERCIPIILANEGVHSDDPSDPGGETWWGIAHAAHPDIAWPPTRDQAIEIYRTQYWPRAAELPWPVNLVVFDGLVNQGNEAAKCLQRALDVTVDAVIGPQTINAAVISEPNDLAVRVMSERVFAYESDAVWETYRLGWLDRCFKTMLAAGKA